MKKISKNTTINIPSIGMVLFEKSHKAKNIIISIKPPNTIRVAVPKRLSFKKAESFTKANKEHITSYFYKNKKNFNIVNFKNKKDYSKYNLAIDTINDFKKIRPVLEKKNFLNYNWKKIIKIVYNK